MNVVPATKTPPLGLDTLGQGGPAGSRLVAVAVVLAGYGLAVFGLRLQNSLGIIAYLAALGAMLLAAPWLARRCPAIPASLAAQRRLVAVGLIVCAASYPLLASNPYQMHVLAMAGLFALMAIGLNITTGYAGLAEFGYIAYYAIGAYTSSILTLRYGLSFWIALPAAMLVTAALSMAVAFPAVRVRGHYLALVTLGFCFIVIQLITNLTGLTGGTQGMYGMEAPAIFGHSFRDPLDLGFIQLPFQANYYFLVLCLLVLAVIFCTRLADSRWGRAWGAMRGDELAAQSCGLNLMQLKLLAFGTGASFGGAAGAIYAHMIGFIDPSSFRVIESVFLLAIVAIGNWRIGGVVAAAMLFTVLPEKMRAFDEWRLLIFGAVLLLVMLMRGRRMISTSN